MNPARPLEGLSVGLSISACEDLKGRSLDLETVNQTVLQLAEVLLGAGARVVFGHDWRPGGVMEGVVEMAIRYQERFSERAEGPAPILNLIAPPDQPWLWREDREAQALRARLRGVVEARQIEFRGDSAPGPGRANALSALRRELTANCHARVCLGGTLDEESYKGWYPGVLEEAILALRSQQPVYAGSLFGGAAARLVEAQRGGRREFYPRRFDGTEIQAGVLVSPPISVGGNGLDERKQRTLWETESIETFIELAFYGLVRWWWENPRRPG